MTPSFQCLYLLILVVGGGLEVRMFGGGDVPEPLEIGTTLYVALSSWRVVSALRPGRS